MKIKQIIEARYTSGDPIADIRSGLIDVIINGKPTDIAQRGEGIEDEPWFYINNRNQVVWNWRSREWPLHLMATKLGEKHEKALKALEYTEKYALMDEILSSKAVKAFKTRIRQQNVESGGHQANVEAKIHEIDQKIARLQAQRDKLITPAID